MIKYAIYVVLPGIFMKKNNITWRANNSFPLRIASIAANWSSNAP
jgi:hypothetical protein